MEREALDRLIDDNRGKCCLARYSDVSSDLIYSSGVVESALLTFLIPTRGNSTAVKRALTSILNMQPTKSVFNVLVIDNDPSGPTDELKDYLKQIPNIQYFVNAKNIGMFGNWNRGIQLAPTKFVAMLHDDDVVLPDYMMKMEKVIKKANRHSKPLAYIKTNCLLKSENSDSNPNQGLLRKIFKTKILPFNEKLICMLGDPGYLGAPTCGSILNRDAVIDVGGFDEDRYPSADVWPILLFQRDYAVYETFGYFGYRYFGENDSSKFETMRGWVRWFYEMQSTLGKCCPKHRRIIERYELEQRDLFVTDIIRTPESSGRIVKKEDFLDICDVVGDEKKKQQLLRKTKMHKASLILKNLLNIRN